MKRAYYIINPNSGKGAIKGKLCSIFDGLQSGGYETTVYMTQARLDATRAAQKACAENYDLIVCSGGDGTLNEVVNGIMNSENRPTLGYIPTGTMNDFARCLKIPRNCEKAALSIAQGNKFSCDIGKISGRYFTYVACFGAYTDVSYSTPQQVKNILGNAAYVLESIKSTLGIRGYNLRIEYDGNVIENEFILGMVANSTSVAGVKMPVDVSLEDGAFEILLIKKPKDILELQKVITKLIAQDTSTEYIQLFKASHINITASTPVAWCIDGEYGGESDKVEIENINKAISIIVPGDGFEHEEEISETMQCDISDNSH